MENNTNCELEHEKQTTLKAVFADAMSLSDDDRATLETYLRTCNRVGLLLEPESVRTGSDETLRALFGNSH